MQSVDILSDEFAALAAEAGLRARKTALDAGHSVVYLDHLGRYVEELPDGRLMHVQFQPGSSRELHRIVIGELTPAAR